MLCDRCSRSSAFSCYIAATFFLLSGSVPFSLAILGVRWLIFFLAGSERTRIPSLILAAILILIGFQLWMFGLVADLMSANRRLVEEAQLRMRRLDAEGAGGQGEQGAGENIEKS